MRNLGKNATQEFAAQLLVYIAGPYSAPTKQEVKKNIQKADCLARKILLLGHIPVTPHKITSFFDMAEETKDWTHDDWITRFAFPLLNRCDCIALVNGWKESKGALQEFGYAFGLHKKIYTEDKIDALLLSPLGDLIVP